MLEYYSVREFAKKHGVSPQAIRKRLNELNADIIGGLILIKKDKKSEEFVVDKSKKRR